MQKHVGNQLVWLKVVCPTKKRRILQSQIVHHPVLNHRNGTKGKKQIHNPV